MRHYVPVAQRERDSLAWGALVSGALDLAADPIPDEEPGRNCDGFLLTWHCRHGSETSCRWCETPDDWDVWP